MSDFRAIKFGFTSGETERARDPGLLIDGYVDFRNASEEVKSGQKFLFLGYKGAGKSALGERLELFGTDTPDEFVKLIHLKDFPFTPFSKIIRGHAEPETKYPVAWSWILLIYLLESFSGDYGLDHPDRSAFDSAVEAFRQMGLAPTDEPGKIVKASSKTSFKIVVPGNLAEFSNTSGDLRPASDIPDFVDSLKRLINGVISSSRHYLIIDGLDDILTSRDVQFKSLSALIFEVSRLNDSFSKHVVPAKIIILCRTDLFERIPGANKNKVRQDSSVELDWYHDPREPDASLLVRAAQMRAKRSLNRDVDIFTEYFPQNIDRTNSKQYLLDMTRHTPRDFLQLLSHLQEFYKGGSFSDAEIKSGLREYSIKYFLPEIQDELSGYATPDEIARIFRVLSGLRKRELKFHEIVKSASSLVTPITERRTYEILEYLFNCSAIGNVQARDHGHAYFTFKYRNRHSAFNERETIVLHRGLWKAMNLI